MAWCPESRVWLEGIGRRDAADVACLKLWGVHALVPDPDYDDTTAHTPHLLLPGSQHSVAGSAAHGLAAANLQQPLLGPGSNGTGSNSVVSSSVFGAPGSTSSPVRRLQQAEANRAWDSPRYTLTAAATATGSGGWDGSSSYSGYPGGYRAGSSDLGVLGLADGGARTGGRAGAWESLMERQYRWMMMLALGLPLLQQASGINTVVYYSSKVRSSLPSWGVGVGVKVQTMLRTPLHVRK